jgi:long-chain acyl-CoA synthetase
MNNPALVSAIGTPYELGNEVSGTPFPLFHIAGLYSLASSVKYGSLFYLIPNPRELGQFIDYMLNYPPTIIGAVPALTEMLLATPEFAQVDLSKLKVWGSGAAPISSETVKQLVQRIGEGKLSDAFGMTETSASYIGNPAGRYKFGSVGIPLPATDIRIMDVETGTKEMPMGEPGEICASGPQVMKGYINLPQETANALRNIDGRTYMYSGDVGYIDEEGFLFLCDRAKDMLIVGGFKVFSVEVEDKLSALPSVEMSAVVGQPDKDRPGNDIVNLFVQLSADHSSRDQDKLRDEIMEYFAANMAVYKKPKVIHFVDAIPLTPIGKIDKKALRSSLA